MTEALLSFLQGAPGLAALVSLAWLLSEDRRAIGPRPERRGPIFALGMKSILAGTLATPMTGAVVGMLL